MPEIGKGMPGGRASAKAETQSRAGGAHTKDEGCASVGCQTHQGGMIRQSLDHCAEDLRSEARRNQRSNGSE